MHCPDGSHFQSKRILEEGTVVEFIKKKNAFVSTPSSVMVQIKKPKNLIVNLEVKLLESDVLNSPRVISFLSNNANDTLPQDMTRLDTTGTGQLCPADLDTTEMNTAPPSPQSVATAQVPATTLTTICTPPVPSTPTSQDTVNTIRSDPAHNHSPSKYYSADPFVSTHSPLQPTGPTPLKLSRQSSNIPVPSSPSDQSNSLTQYAPVDTSNPLLLLNDSLTQFSPVDTSNP